VYSVKIQRFHSWKQSASSKMLIDGSGLSTSRQVVRVNDEIRRPTPVPLLPNRRDEESTWTSDGNVG
jgi:hypothetical protein